MGGLGLLMRRRAIQAHPTEGSQYIHFTDEAVFNILMAKGISSDGVGITKKDAANVKSIGTWFRNNTNIASFNELRYFTNVTSLDNYAFSGCSKLANIDLSNVVTIGASCFTGNAIQLDYLDLSQVTYIGSNGLAGIGVRELNISGLVSMTAAAAAADATYGKKAILESVIFSDDLKTIPTMAFYNYTALKTLTGTNNVTSVDRSAFEGCSSLVSIDFPNLVSLGLYAFMKSGLEEVKSLGMVTSLPQQCFMNCNRLRSVPLPLGLTTIGSQCFNTCNLQSIDIGENVASIVNSAFEKNTLMEYAICRALTPPQLANNYVFAQTNNCPIYVPDESVDAYKGASYWSNLSSRIKPLSEYQG